MSKKNTIGNNNQSNNIEKPIVIDIQKGQIPQSRNPQPPKPKGKQDDKRTRTKSRTGGFPAHGIHGTG